jgi:hypothetical protein
VKPQSGHVRGDGFRSGHERGVNYGLVLCRGVKPVDPAIEDIAEQRAVLHVPAQQAPADAVLRRVSCREDAEWLGRLAKPVNPGSGLGSHQSKYVTVL